MEAVLTSHEQPRLCEAIATRRNRLQHEHAGEISLIPVSHRDDEPTHAFAIVPCEADDGLFPAPSGADASVDDLVDCIFRQYDRLQASARSTVTMAIGIGRMLIRLKEVQGHGMWLPFFEASLADRISLATANLYMKISREQGERDPAEFATTSLTQLAGWNRPTPKAAARELPTPSSTPITSEAIPAEEPHPHADPARDEAPETIARLSPPQEQCEGRVGYGGSEVAPYEVPEAEEEVTASATQESASLIEECGDENESSELSASAEDEDAEFERRVRALELRAKLKRPEILDREVWAFDRVSPILIEALRDVDMDADNASKLSGWHEIGLTFRRRLAFAAGVLPPEHWELCPKCRGRGEVIGVACGACVGQGFVVKHAESGRFEMPPLASSI